MLNITELLDPWRIKRPGPRVELCPGGFSVYTCPRLLNWYPEGEPVHQMMRRLILSRPRTAGFAPTPSVKAYRRWVVRAYMHEEVTTEQVMELLNLLEKQS